MERRFEMESHFIKEQNKLLEKLQKKSQNKIEEVKTVAGVDLAYWQQEDGEYAVCCVVVIDFLTKEVIERQHQVGKIEVPYIPGCLAFREIGLVKKTVEMLVTDVDVFVFDGNGYLHPRHMGLATHAGILLDKPSLGVAKSYYKIYGKDFEMPLEQKFAYTDIVINNEVYGRVVRTQEHVKPIFLSVGNKMDLETAMEIVKRLVTKESRIPIPTRYADIMTHDMRKQYDVLL